MSAYWSTGVELPNLQQPALARLTDFVTPLELVFFLRHVAMPEINGGNLATRRRQAGQA